MSILRAGVTTFCSCNKAGSIPHFTQHLSSYPNDFTALRWRGRAYGIIGDNESALADFRRAMRVSSDPERSLAEADVVNCEGNDMRRYTEILQRTTQNYPRCAQAWFDLGSFYFQNNDNDTSLSLMKTAVTLGKENGETGSPWYPWCNHTIGMIYLKNYNTTEAKIYFNEAISSCSSLTVGHLGLCNASIMESNMHEAKRHYQTARGLNPVLVNYDSFDAYRNAVFASGNSGGTGHGGSSGANNGGGGSSGHGSGGGSSGHGRGGGGNDNDDDPFRRWKLFELGSPWVAKYKGKRLALDKEGKFWYSFDTARHGGAFLKKYRNKRSYLEFVGSVDENWRDITGKHESNEGVRIYKSDLDTVRKI